MNDGTNRPLFADLENKTCVITGGTGLLGRAIAEALARYRANVAIIGTDANRARAIAEELRTATGGNLLGLEANVLDRESLAAAKIETNRAFGPVDILVSCAGGNDPKATTGSDELSGSTDAAFDASFFGLDMDALRNVFDLNVHGSVLSALVFARDMAERKKGAVLLVSSMASLRPLSRIPAYSASKAAVNNFTAWLAVHLAKVNVRVNAIAPGFFISQQNEFLLLEKAGSEYTARGKKIIEHTPMGRFGEPSDICGTALHLVSDSSAFVTGAVIPVDGGFGAFAGV